MEAHNKCHFVDPNFVPIGQSKKPGMVLEVAQTAIPKLTLETITPVVETRNSRDTNEPEDTHDELEQLDDLLDELEKEIQSYMDETNDEDGPDWMFDEGEKVSKNKEFFCPTVHHAQLLHIFIKHFCQHPFSWSTMGSGMPSKSVTMLFTRCTCSVISMVYQESGLLELLVPSKSLEVVGTVFLTISYLTTDNYDHPELLEAAQTRLSPPHCASTADQLIYILIYEVTLAYFVRSQVLSHENCLRWAPTLTNFQKSFKSHWAKLQKKGLSRKGYITSVKDWMCTCGWQKFDWYHLCKHLVQAVPELLMLFWTQSATSVTQNHKDMDEGCITDGDNPGWIIEKDSLLGEAWRDIETPKMDEWCEKLLTHADKLETATKILHHADFTTDITRHETTGRTQAKTWTNLRNRLEPCYMANVMGYQNNLSENQMPVMSGAGMAGNADVV
ncbi:hypothetical protein C8J56DRAFT_881921 [Mycena floridula]|nr:hypothetical protein C8J56DRAFT_881921 [Mycena floridula]